MPVLKRLTPEQIREHFTHKGFLGVVPVYVDMRKEMPAVTERNGIPGFLLDWQARLIQSINWLGFSINPNFQPLDFPLLVEELEG